LNKFTANIIKLTSLPPSIAARKLFFVPVRKLAKRSIIKDEQTYINTNDISVSKPNLKPFFALIPGREEITKYEGELKEYSQHILSHEFNILHSGFSKYAVSFDRNDFLNTCINPSNQTEANKILSLLPDNYKLIDWQIDAVSKYRWDSSTKSQLLKYENLSGVDVKLPWELGRLQHLIPLSYAVVFDKEEKFLREFENQLIDFIGTNPPGYGIQWKSTMDVAIRLINIIFAFSIIRKFNIKTNDDFELIVLKSIQEHIGYIKDHLEWNDGLRGNHYLFNLLGILIGEIFISPSFEKRSNYQFALSELRKEILYQFNEDGGNFEASLPYHYFTAEGLFLCRTLLKLSGIELADSKELLERIEQIIEFSLANVDINNTIAQIGDNDSGYILKLYPSDIVSEQELSVSHIMRYLSPDYKESHRAFFPQFGLYVVKNDKIFFTFRCGDVGQKGKGGHAHNDALSFCLKINHLPFFVDTGTYCYLPFPEERNKFRSSAYHNTLTISNKEQNLILNTSSEDLFWLIPRANPEIEVLDNRVIKGTHSGYGDKTERIFEIDDNTISGSDFCEHNGEKQIHFHLHPAVTIREEKEKIILTNQSTTISLEINDEKFKIEDYEYSPAYGVKENAKKIIIFSHSDKIKWKIKY